jgi:aspartate 1-decarboxylase
MKRTMLKSKIHKATVNGANVYYEGSITIDEDLMDAAKIAEYEQVDVYNLYNAIRFSTYVIKGERGKGEICLNGAAARLAAKGDLIIICSYSICEEEEVLHHKPILVYVDEKNRIKERKVG